MNLPTSFRQLWRGELPLSVAFWRYLITYDLMLNLGATLASLSVILAEGPIALAAVLHLLPVPYSLLAAAGTWKSAERYRDNPNLAMAAKAATLLWVIAMLVF